MKIAMLHGPRDLHIEEHPLDTANLKPNEIWVETEISALKIGTDRGNYEGAEQIPGAPAYPRWVGDSNLGMVRGVGRAVRHFRVGDRVVSRYPHQSEYIASEPECIVNASKCMVKVPEAADPEDAVFAHLYTLSALCYRKALFQPGENVAVVGLGVVYPANGMLARRSPNPRMPVQADALLKSGLRSMTTDKIRPPSHAKGIPAYWPPVPSLTAIIARPAASTMDCSATVAAAAYWWLSESIEKAVLVARYTAIPTKTNAAASVDRILSAGLSAVWSASVIGTQRIMMTTSARPRKNRPVTGWFRNRVNHSSTVAGGGPARLAGT